MSAVKQPVAVVSCFLWIGFVCAISFMEAWLKFRAPGISIPLGLGIGRLVFGALNKVEWVLMLSILVQLLFPMRVFAKRNMIILIPVIIVLLQTFLLLPFLDQRAEIIIQGGTVPSSNMHFYYIILEFVKVVCLFVFGVLAFRKV